MAATKYANQSEYAFIHWMGQSPESAHPFDNQRFMEFAKTVARYRNKKWLDRSYFMKRILSHTPNFDQEYARQLWEKLIDMVEFYKVAPLPTYGNTDDKPRFTQRGSINGKNYVVEISQAEYLGGGATKETMKKAEYF